MNESTGISLQAVVDGHLKRLMELRDAVTACDAGLFGLSEQGWSGYVDRLPPQPRFGPGVPYREQQRRARYWLTANALKDLIVLNGIYFEQIRQFVELSKIGASDLSNEAKEAEAKVMAANKPQTLDDAVVGLDALLAGAMGRKPEIRSMESLFGLFGALASGQSVPQNLLPLVVTLNVPEVKGGDEKTGQLAYSVRRVQRTYPDAASAEPDRELIYQIFFTSFTICREVAESCQHTLAPPDTVAQPSDLPAGG